jgi:GDP-L-fucose synthase
MNEDSRIYVAGHTGLVGAAIVRFLEARGFRNLIARGHDALDLTRADETEAFFAETRPEYVFLAAAKVGGIKANDSFPVDFIRTNLAIQTNVMWAAHRYGVEKLLALGSVCIYPRLSPQPVREEHLLTGALEPTNEAYAIAKIAGLVMCRSYRRQYGERFVAAMPTNLYGPGDNFDLEAGHVVPSLIRKFHEAKKRGGPVQLWGRGTARRDFLFVDDAVEALVLLMDRYEGDDPHGFVNVGSGTEVSIGELAELVAKVVGYEGEVHWDASKPDGAPRRLLDCERIQALGWAPKYSLEEGLRATYAWYSARHD